MNPVEIVKVSHTEYKDGVSLSDMIREDLVAERTVATGTDINSPSIST